MAPVYGFWSRLFESKAARRAYGVAGFSGGESVLEVATGGGEFYSMLAKTRGLSRLVGVDLSAPMLLKSRAQQAASGNDRPSLCRADAFTLPFQDSVFDLLFNLYMLDLLLEADLPQVLQEFARVLRPGGRLIVLSMAEQGWLVNTIWMALCRLSPLWVGGCRPMPVGKALAASGWKIALREQISQSGFRSELFVAQYAGEERQ